MFAGNKNGLLSAAKPMDKVRRHEKHLVHKLKAFKIRECDECIDPCNIMVAFG